MSVTSFKTATRALGPVEPATFSIAKEVHDAARKAGHDVPTIWGFSPDGAEHSTGRALDFMVTTRAAGDFIRDYVWTHRVRLRLQHVIWRQAITSTTNTPGVVRKMADRGNPTANHMDHPHVLVNMGKYKAPTLVAKIKDKLTPAKKSNAVVATEVIAGKWGNGEERKKLLTAAGYDYAAVQAEVTRRSPLPVPAVAAQVIAGRWGNGAERRRRLTAAGYNYDAVQREVERQLKRRR